MPRTHPRSRLVWVEPLEGIRRDQTTSGDRGKARLDRKRRVFAGRNSGERLAERARAFVLGVFVITLAPAARAQSTKPNAENKAAADTLFRDAKRLMQQKHYSEACPKFQESLALDPGLGTMLWLADCFERNGQTASAWGQFRDAEAALRLKKDPREKVAHARAEKLLPQLARLTIEVPAAARVDGLEVRRDGALQRNAMWDVATPVDPGTHVVLATAPGFRDWQTSVVVEPQEGVAVTIPPLTRDAPEAGPQTRVTPPGVAAPRQPEKSGGTQRLLGLVVGGVGLVGVGVGSFFGLRALSQRDDSNAEGHCKGNACDPVGDALRDDAQESANLATVAFSLGAAALAGGVVLFVTAPRETSRDASARSSAVVPMASHRGGGLVWVGSF